MGQAMMLSTGGFSKAKTEDATEGAEDMYPALPPSGDGMCEGFCFAQGRQWVVRHPLGTDIEEAWVCGDHALTS